MFRHALPLLALLAAVPPTLAQTAWPDVKMVEAQPLLAQVRRLEQAMDNIGFPLPADTRAALAKLKPGDGDEKVAAAAQKALDALCVAAVEIDKDGAVRATPPAHKPALIEQGWNPHLVKVVNRAGSTGMLRADSPNARPVPNAPKDEVASRWLGLAPYRGQPLLPNLSGLGLEYTVLQLYSRDSGEKSAVLAFTVEGQKPGENPVIREWRFDKDAAGWKAANQCKIAAEKGSLTVTSEGNDPYVTTPVEAKAGPMVLRFWAKFDKPGGGQVYWATKDAPAYDGKRAVNFPIEPGRATEYEVRFRNAGELTGLRIDTGNQPGTAVFDWITLAAAGDAKGAARATVAFDARPSVAVTFKVTEFDGTPAMAAFVVRDKDGRVYPAQSKRLAPDFFFQQQIYRATGETVRLPAGTYSVRCSRGPESVPEVKELVVADKPVELRYVVQRWADPSKRGWWSGDHHIHAAGCQHYENPTEGVHPPDMLRHIMGEDLKVGCCLTWGPCFDYQKRFFTGKPDDVSKYPYILRYDVEVSGFGSHVSGHLNLLRLKEQIPPGGESKHHWPTLGMNTLRWAKKQGAVCGPAHSASGLTRTVGEVEGKDGPGGLPHFKIPAYDGIGANEFIVQVTHEVPGPEGKPVPAVDFISTMDTDRRTEFNMWYHVLNCGFRTRASGETDFPCISGERVGMGRVYVKLDGKLEFNDWVQGLADGRSYVSDGTAHLMDFTAESGDKKFDVGKAGSELRLDKPGKVKLTVAAAVYHADKRKVPVELVVNGYPVATQDIVADGKVNDLTFEADVAKSSWVAVRTFPSAHTNPFFVVVGGKPIRANKSSAAWCLRGVDQCWAMKKGTYRKDEQEQAEKDYEHARKTYQRIMEESEK